MGRKRQRSAIARGVDSIVHIYGLVDPRSGIIRYVGNAFDPKARIHGHMQDARNDPVRTRPLTRWLRELTELDLRPVVRTIESVTATDAEQSERWWIAELREECDLLNVRAGGYRHVDAVKRYVQARTTKAGGTLLDERAAG